MDRFLAFENPLMEVERIRSWVEVGGGLHHLPIILRTNRQDSKPGTPFKFNLE
jgi:hypothetical protein